MTPHIEAKKEEIAKTVLMPGDPKRAKFIADNYLENVKIVNDVRNMTAYTGYYKDKMITVFPSGMGIPSMGIYAYELFKFYEVDEIIRIGTGGSNNKNIKLLDVVLASSAYSKTSFEELFDKDNMDSIEATKELNEKIIETAKNKNIKIHIGEIITSDVFDVYVDFEKYISNFPEDRDFLASEMEAYALFYHAKKQNKKAATIITIVDSKYDKKQISSKDREVSLREMIEIALESVK
jgi:purine-nucleoside phosphorylase, family 1 (deoD)